MEGFLEVKSHNISEMCFGWLSSSNPPVRKQQWKRRYFVLQESVLTQLPGQNATLTYYKNEKRRGKKGVIDLEHCDEVLSTLDSPHYPHLFGIKTQHKKGSVRTYYLAAPSEVDMGKWVNSLCTVLGLKENDDPPVPPERPELSSENNFGSQTAVSRGNEHSLSSESLPKLPPTRVVKPINTVSAGNTGHQHAKEEYIPLDDCYSGTPKNDLNNDDPILSIPLDFAPPPPDKIRENKLIDEFTGSGETYDHPSKCYQPKPPEVDDNDNLYKLPPHSHPSVLDSSPPDESGGSIYKYPPPQMVSNQKNVFKMVPPPQNNYFINSGTDNDVRGSYGQDDDEDVYKVPPARHEQVEYDTPPIAKPRSTPQKSVERDSNSSSASKGSVSNNDDLGFGDNKNAMYSGNSLSQRLDTMNVRESQELYDTPPSCKQLLEVVPPPPRPHKGPIDSSTDSRYINLPSNSMSHPNKITRNTPDVPYDFPVSTSSMERTNSDVQMLGLSPPPPGDHKKGAVLHKYTNAPPGYVPVSAEQDSYMPMANPPSAGSYLPMDRPSQATYDSSYLPMDSNSKQQQGDSYLSMDKQKYTQDYLNMNDESESPRSPNDSYTPVAQRQNDRSSSNSIYAVMPEGPPRQYMEPDNRLSDIYSSHPSNIPVDEDIYAPPPSNRPVENELLNMYPPSPVNRDSEIYAYPPSNQPVPPPPFSHSSMLDSYPPAPSQIGTRDSTYDTPPRPQLYHNDTGSPRFTRHENIPGAVPFFNVERSRSFKRKMNYSSNSKAEIQLPKRKSNSEDSSSSEDESESTSTSETKSTSSHDHSLDSVRKKSTPQIQIITKRSLHSTPPPPKKGGPIEYLELDLEMSQKSDKSGSDPEKSPAASAKSPGRTQLLSSTTEYREIDFLKTGALSEAIKDRQNKRKSSEKSVDE